MPRVAATAASAARSAPAMSPATLSAHAVTSQMEKARSGRRARRAAAPPRSATASHSLNRPCRASDVISAWAISATIVSSGSATSEAAWSSSAAPRAGSPATDSHQAAPSRISTRSSRGASAGSSSTACW